MIGRLVAKNAVLLSQLSRTNVSAQAVRCMGGHGNHKSLAELAKEHRVTINDLPVPAGSWQENYNKRNAKWNMYLAANVVFFFATIFAMEKGQVFIFHSAPDYKKIEVDATKAFSDQ